MHIAKISLKIPDHAPLCRVTRVSIILLVFALVASVCSIEIPRSLQALLLTAGFIGAIFGLGRRHHVVDREHGETA
ncbi:hypothetical protein [Rhizobium straminoryzae]|uniref:Uncharacterized protein n=1 Tax=Rhizobium straminoryzae TaxID=1387186 RepID=A0A549SMD6_9HYPH|nr:hypothetical protein [Rhizobium straminoryzae]TRL30796.1 hypothetical protein FNA46_25000 [Rhizobium straminoryzae]